MLQRLLLHTQTALVTFWRVTVVSVWRRERGTRDCVWSTRGNSVY